MSNVYAGLGVMKFDCCNQSNFITRNNPSLIPKNWAQLVLSWSDLS